MTLEKVLSVVEDKHRKSYCTSLHNRCLYLLNEIRKSDLDRGVKLFLVGTVRDRFLKNIVSSSLHTIEYSFMKNLLCMIFRKEKRKYNDK